AIDFGIIIDGAVIIVEFIAFSIVRQSENLKQLTKTKQQQEINHITLKSASKMMNSAIFRQLIILIVFIPILSLSGIEGKMFKPMVLTFSFALLGAMLLCLTYVPVVASMFLKPSGKSGSTFSNQLLQRLTSWYTPVISWALGNKKRGVGLAALLLANSIGVFLRLGGAFTSP